MGPKRAGFEQAMLKVFDRLDDYIDSKKNDEAADTVRCRPNPTNVEMRMRERQLEAVIRHYKKELSEWDLVSGELEGLSQRQKSQTTNPVVPKMTSETQGVIDIAAAAKTAVENYVLQADHMRHILRKLETRQQRTSDDVCNVADTLNAKAFDGIGIAAEGTAPLVLQASNRPVFATPK